MKCWKAFCPGPEEKSFSMSQADGEAPHAYFLSGSFDGSSPLSLIAHPVCLPGKLEETLACLEDLDLPVVDLAADLTGQHICENEGGIRLVMDPAHT